MDSERIIMHMEAIRGASKREVLVEHNSIVLGSQERFFKKDKNGGKLPATARVNIWLTELEIKERNDKMRFLNALFGDKHRKIQSTKDLRVGEFISLQRALSNGTLELAIGEYKQIRRKAIQESNDKLKEALNNGRARQPERSMEEVPGN